MADTDVTRRAFLGSVPLLALAAGAHTLRAADRRLAGGSPQQLPVPDWMQVNRDASRVHLQVVAGATEENNGWNFNGLIAGKADIVVPEGFEVRVTFRNDDPAMAHSMGIDERKDPWPPMFEDPSPVFEGAITTDPTSLTGATQPGETEELTFTATPAGEYALVCFLPGHALTGMWTGFVVSAEGAAGLRDRS